MSQDELGEISRLWVEIERLKHTELPRWVFPLDTAWAGTAGSPMTSTDWDGDARSTTAKTTIDLSAVFGVPAGVKAVLLRVACRDSGSAGADCYINFWSTNAAGIGPHVRPAGRANDLIEDQVIIVPCDSNGDIYYQAAATGASTLDVWIYIDGYLL